MAVTTVSLALDKLRSVIARYETGVPHGILREFEEIKEKLEQIQPFLIDADRKAAEGDNTNEEIKIWAKQLIQASLRIENVIDQYMIYIEQKHHDRGCATSLFKAFYFIGTFKLRRQIALETKQIKSIVCGIKEGGYQIDPSLGQGPRRYREVVQWHDPRMASHYFDVVGFEGARDELTGWLVKGPVELSVISVVGMGGLGKTTLVTRVFNNLNVIAHFNFRAWITVSRSYTVEGLMRDLLVRLRKEEERTPQGISEIDLHSLIDKVTHHLRQKRYVVIFDDVWNAEFWDQIQVLMLDNKNGSRILITTRNKDVVYSCNRYPFIQVHELKPLSQEESMELFCKKAFRFHNNQHVPRDLRKISSDFVEKCEGLPLAIVAIGGLLYVKERTLSEWEKVLMNLSSEMHNNPQLIGVTKILDLSYDDLPYYLKSCFLYFGIYPEGYEVKSTRLIRHWIAEGYVQHQSGKSLEDIAQLYLTELINRCLVQVSSFTIDGRAKSCRVHGLLHDMILKKFKEISFCQRICKEDEPLSNGIFPRLSITEPLSNGIFPRLSITTISNDLMRSTENSGARSLFLFADKNSASTNKFVQMIPSKFRLLKVLDFENSRMHSIPENWRNLAQLKFLSLRDAWFLTTKLPKFIGKLQKLETLDIRGTDVREIPQEICKLRRLQHLLGTDMKLFELKNGLGGMTSLQTLRHVNLTMDDDDGIELIRELGKLKQLRNLSLTDVKEEQGSALCSSISEMTNLQKLSINSNEEVIDLPVISSLPKLQKLCLNGMLKKFPEWVPQLQNLKKLTLRCSKLTFDPLEMLENMPHLLFLVMDRAYEGKSLYFKNGGFQQLRGLFLGPLDNLKSIIIDEGALPSLKKLELWRIPELKTVPSGIQHLKKLEVFDIFAMSNEFNNYIAPEGGPENPIIKHVPLVTITAHFGEITRVIRHSSWHYNS